MTSNQGDPSLEALKWYVDNGVTDVLENEPVDKTQPAEPIAALVTEAKTQKKTTLTPEVPKAPPMGSNEARKSAEELAKNVKTLDELREAIASFDGLSVKKTALNMVFCDGNPKAPIMVIGEAPGADEDEQGKPFVGASGQLLDKILAGIGLSRKNEEANKSVYVSNILNWRPPGNRTPTPAEMSIALPFIEKHIQLIAPKILILVGNTPMKSLLDSKEGIMKMRGSWHDYKTVSNIGELGSEILVLPTFHPAFLLRNPMKKKDVWQDMIALQKKRIELGIAE